MADKPGYYPFDGSGQKGAGKLTPARPDYVLERITTQLRAAMPEPPVDLRNPAGISDRELELHAARLSTKRDEKGRFRKGTPSPNPHGAPRKRQQQRMFGEAQAVEDVLSLFERPVNVTRGGRTTVSPAIKAIIERLIAMAVEGDMSAIRKCLEIHGRASRAREQTLAGLLESVAAIEAAHKDRDMPAQTREALDLMYRYVNDAQYRPGISAL